MSDHKYHTLLPRVITRTIKSLKKKKKKHFQTSDLNYHFAVVDAQTQDGSFLIRRK